jgi:ABC-type lipoprotein export system ATPase subunit
MDILKISNLSKIYGKGETAVEALKNVSLAVSKGEFVSVVGPSGSGKSTLLNMIGAWTIRLPAKYTLTAGIFCFKGRRAVRFSPAQYRLCFPGL